MTFTKLTEIIAEKEGLKDEVNIAQIKEIARIILEIVASLPYSEASKLLAKYQDRSL